MPNEEATLEFIVRYVDNEHVEVRVEDNGTGIQFENIEDIFLPFVSSNENEETGLGLWIVKKEIESIGGSISVSNKENAGAKFILRFRCNELRGV
jgi:signal transduction histidine kinase